MIALALFAGLFPVLNQQPAEENRPIILGAAPSLGYAIGRDGLRAAEMAIDDINRAGGVRLGGVVRQLKLEYVDSRAMLNSVPVADALLALNKLITEKKPVAIVAGPERSEICLAAMDLISEYRLPMMIPCSKSPLITQKILGNYEKYKYSFRLTLDSLILARLTADYIVQLGADAGFSRVFYIQEDAAWATGSQSAISGLLNQKGWINTGSETSPLGNSDFSMPLLRAKQAKAQVICINFSTPEGGALIEQANTMRIPAMIVGMASPTVAQESWVAYRGKVEYASLAIAEAGNVPVTAIPASLAFYKQFVSRYGTGPGADSVPPAVYDGVYLLAAAMETTNSLDGDILVSALEQSDYQGVIGRIRFDQKHQAVYADDPSQGALALIMQWQGGGKRMVVWPPSVAEGKRVVPPWME